MLGATAVWFMMKINLPAHKIMEVQMAADELRVIYRNYFSYPVTP
jgi:hypothetical protein